MRLWPTVWIVCFSFERQRHGVEARRGIATKVAELIGGRETIIADAGTTVLEALRTVGDKSNLTVVIDFQDLRRQHRRVVLPDLDGRYLQPGVPVLSGGARVGDRAQVPRGSCRAEPQGKTLSLPILTT